MNMILIDTFLMITENRSITQAANKLYVSQSTVSSRLQQLEDQIGTPLIRRNKGTRSIELTPEGNDFLVLAQRYKELQQELETFTIKEHRISLTLACPDSLNTTLFVPLFQKLIQATPHIDLHVRTHQSIEIHDIVNNHEADIGFVFYKFNSRNLITEPVFSEHMVLMLSSKGDWGKEPIHPNNLDPNFEIYLGWHADILQWHNYWFPGKNHPYAHVDTAYLLGKFMKNPKCWCLCPVSIARNYINSSDVIIRECSKPIPERTSYMITEKSKIDSEKTQVFRKIFFDFVKDLKLDQI